MYNVITQVVLLSRAGKLSTAIADSLFDHLYVQQVCISSDTFLYTIRKGEELFSKADVVILNLSETNGKAEETLSHFNILYPKLPVIVLHLYDQKTFAEAFLGMGAQAYLPVNFQTEDLLSAIEHVLRQKKFIAKNVY